MNDMRRKDREMGLEFARIVIDKSMYPSFLQKISWMKWLGIKTRVSG